MTSFCADVRKSEKMMTSSTSFTKTVINEFFLMISSPNFMPFFPTIYYKGISYFQKTDFFGGATAGPPSPPGGLDGTKILGKYLDKSQKVWTPIISRLKVLLNRFIWGHFDPSPVCVGFKKHGALRGAKTFLIKQKACMLC